MAKDSYHNYVISNGEFIGDFETMYKKFDDPWNQSLIQNHTEKNIGIQLMKRYNFHTVVEIGCGIGYYTNAIAQNKFNVTGVDISETAIYKARHIHSNIKFEVGDICDFSIYERLSPQCIF